MSNNPAFPEHVQRKQLIEALGVLGISPNMVASVRIGSHQLTLEVFKAMNIISYDPDALKTYEVVIPVVGHVE